MSGYVTLQDGFLFVSVDVFVHVCSCLLCLLARILLSKHTLHSEQSFVVPKTTFLLTSFCYQMSAKLRKTNLKLIIKHFVIIVYIKGDTVA